jgi:hypothetical protein
MIRNIPNKYTRDMLLDLIQTKNKKKFDFFYLPIDYSVILLFKLELMQYGLCFYKFYPFQIHQRFL